MEWIYVTTGFGKVAINPSTVIYVQRVDTASPVIGEIVIPGGAFKIKDVAEMLNAQRILGIQL